MLLFQDILDATALSYGFLFFVRCLSRNRGKYDIAFAFRVRRGVAASLFTVEPNNGVIGPGQAAEVRVTFCSREETHLKVRGGYSGSRK